MQNARPSLDSLSAKDSIIAPVKKSLTHTSLELDFGEDDDFNSDPYYLGASRTPTPGPPTPGLDSRSFSPTHWSCSNYVSKPKPKLKEAQGHAALKSRPSAELVRPTPSTPSTCATPYLGNVTVESRSQTPRVDRACAQTGSHLHWRRPPARFRRRRASDSLATHTTKTSEVEGGRVCNSDLGYGDTRAWSTEPASHLPNASGGARAATALGVRQEPFGTTSHKMPVVQSQPRSESAFAEFRCSDSRATESTLSEVKSARRSVELRDLVPLPVGPQSARAGKSAGQESKIETRADELKDHSLDRLAAPRQPGASEGSKHRSVARAFEEYAHQATSALLPNVPTTDYSGHTFSDMWHTAGENGYRSAIFRAAVRCHELQQGTGLGPDDGIPAVIESAPGRQGLVFSGQPNSASSVIFGPEIVRLHTTCVLFSELCSVSSPMQDTLRFVFRELCQCIFEGFCPGVDVFTLIPFFVTAIQTRADLATEKARAETAEHERDEHGCHAASLQKELREVREEMNAVRKTAQHHCSTFETHIRERDALREEIAHLQQVGQNRSNELFELSKEFDIIQGQLFTTRRELEQSKKYELSMASASKEQKSEIEHLSGRISDLQYALQLASDDGVVHRFQEEQMPPPVFTEQLSPELEQELAIRMQQNSSSGAVHEGSILHEGRRILKMPMPDGGCQVVIRSCMAEDQQNGKQIIAGPSLIVSGEAFSALEISMSLPRPPNPMHFRTNEDEEIVKEVRLEVDALTREHNTLMGLARHLRRELKETLKLIPEWNRDELRGLLRSILILDEDETFLVPCPVGTSTAIVGLGETEEVPSYLRYDGLLRLKNMDRREVTDICEAIWFLKTSRDISSLREGCDALTLSEYLGDVYVPQLLDKKKEQMEHMYSLLLSIRNCTTLAKPDDASGAQHRRRTAYHSGPQSESITRRRKQTFADEAATTDVEPAEVEAPPSQTTGPMHGTRCKQQLSADLHFHASCEVLFRSLLGELHEDIHHDQTAMLVAFCHLLAALSERLTPSHWYPPPGTPKEIEPAVIGIAELSAMMRLFFPSKPREHFSALKKILMLDSLGEDLDENERITLFLSEEEEAPQQMAYKPRRKTITVQELRTSEWGKHGDGMNHDDTELEETAHSKEPPVVDLGKILGLRTWRGQIVDTDSLVSDLMTQPTPLMLELRRQHMIECFMFTNRLQKALRSSHTTTVSETGSPMINARQADAALAAADENLTEDQRCIYILRGFGRRLPDPPTVELHGGNHAVDHESSPESRRDSLTDRDAENACKRAAAFYKTRTLLNERMTKLVKEDQTVAADIFIRRLSADGVVKSADLWNPEVSIQEVIRESGLEVVRSSTATALLQDLVGSTGSITDAALPKSTSVTDLHRQRIPSSSESEHETVSQEVVERYYQHAVSGRDIQELSIGYTQLGLLHWLASPC